MPAKRERKQKKSGGGLIVNSVSAVIICAALVLGVSVFFRVSSIEVSGASRYTAREVIEASGIREGANLVFLNRETAENNIMKALVYVGKVTVSRSLPNKVSIEIHESGTVACVETENGFWTIDNYCRLLEPCPLSEVQNYIKVTGFSALSPKAGEKIKVSGEDKSKTDYLELLLDALYSAGMLENVGSIDMSTSGNPQLEYMGRFRVKLGKNADLESKLAILAGAIERLSDTETGVFDLSAPKEASFMPD